ncbi:MAG: deoxyribose-phosphate aldolase [Clostridia bacterium]|nr:deoxyribose-phosphate aldolase [Clostridia bacterium]
MDTKEILAHADHTLLAVDASWEDIRRVLEEAVFYRCASACIPPSYVHKAADYVEGMVKICTVIGFPNGYSTTAVKCVEAAEAVRDGADEIDMVINLGWVRNRQDDRLLDEINRVRDAIDASARECGRERDHIILKVIVETCLLTEEEKIRMCGVVSESGADYIKTSTGFSKGGATFDDIALFAAHVKNGLKIKAAGGISSLEDAEKFLQLGADRLGTSRIVSFVRGAETNGRY